MATVARTVHSRDNPAGMLFVMPVQTASIMKTEQLLVKDEHDEEGEQMRALTPEERTQLLEDMHGEPLLAYSKKQIFGKRERGAEPQFLQMLRKSSLNRRKTFGFEHGLLV